MIVRCRATEPAPEQVGRFGKPFAQPPLLELGQEYVVLALQQEVDSLIWGSGTWLQIPLPAPEDDDGALPTLIFAPLCLFEVVDGSLSSHWELRQWEDGSVTAWPPSFYADYYHDDLRAGKAAVLDDFHAVWQTLDAEARGGAL